MIWKKLNNRNLYILESLERDSINEDTLVEKLDISKKTLSNTLKQLNNKLRNCAIIASKEKEISLFVYDYNLYKNKLNDIRKENESFNNEKFRLIYIIKYLFTNDMVTLGDLSFNMVISKTTLNKDIIKLNDLLRAYDIKIEGKTNVGISIKGNELDIRNFVIENCYDEVYTETDNTRLVKSIITKTLSPYLIDEDTLENMKMFLNIAILRIEKGNILDGNNENNKENIEGFTKEVADILKNKVFEIFNIDLNDKELNFITIPLKGMRTPLITSKISDIKIGSDIYELIDEIFNSIKRHMDLEVDLGKLIKDFNYHVYFLLNRIKLDYHIDNVLNDEIRKEYRVAYKIAEIAANVIEDKLGKNVNDSEKSYLASYFQIYIVEKLDLVNKNGFKIAIYTDDEINDLSLKRKLKASDLTDELSISIIDNLNVNINRYDLLITNKDVSVDIPSINGNEVYKLSSIKEKIESLREKKNMILNNRFLKSVFLNELNEDRMFILKDENFKNNLSFMLDSLVSESFVDEDFKERVFDREKISSTMFSNQVAFPHAKCDNLTVCLGINEKYAPNLIFLVGVPEDLDEVLIKLYDEIVTIANDENLVEKISKIKSYPKLMEFFIKDTNLFR
ncbi:BglG family transcription antiterminator [Anaerococcus hydrogenalis]|uniref:BglG family transcription antiterminator n=1 Tax=Anaerococcus hydrogenalis TaxID=33029 RepID=UPI0023F0EC55|nr:PRD domain-containing protein [Anaerococcus hydrogenalis]